MQLTSEHKLMLAVVNTDPSEAELQYIDSLLPMVQDWEYTMRLLTQHGSAPLLHVKLPHLANAHCIPPQWVAHVQQVYFKTLSRNMLLYNAFAEAAQALQQAGIKVVGLKGIYLAHTLYDDIALRQLSDIDILVPMEQGQLAVDVLAAMGYVPHDPSVTPFIASQTEIVHYPPMVRAGVSIEVHIRLHRKNEAYALDTAHMMAFATPWQCNGLLLHALSINDLLVHLCVHIDKHFEGGHIQMKCFSDIALLLHKHRASLQWFELVDLCRHHKCERIVFKYLLLTAKCHAVRLPADIFEAYNHLVSPLLCERYMRYFHCEYDEKFHATTHLANIKQIDNPLKKARYLLELVFPPQSFMLQKYHLQRNGFTRRFWWLWYGYRWWVGVKGLF